MRPDTSHTLARGTDLRDALTLGTDEAVQQWLRTVPGSWSRSEELHDLTDAEVRRLVALVLPPTALELFGSIDSGAVSGVCTVLTTDQAAALVGLLDDDQAVEVLRRLPAERRDGILGAVQHERGVDLQSQLSWHDDSAGARMSPAVSVPGGATVAEAVDAVREQARSTSLEGDNVFVTASPGDRLVGAVSYLDLLLAQPGDLVADLMDPDVVSVDATQDQEVAARLLTDHDLAALPVVLGTRLVGVITVDAVVDILDSESTEDAELQGGSAPLDVPYLRASPWLLWRKRIVWLLVLFLAEMYTGTVLRHFEEELDAVVALAFFVPLLIGTGGNTGTQITTTLIRAMAVGQVAMRDMFRIVRKELSTAVLIAASIAGLAWLRALTLGVGGEIALTVSLSVVAIILWASLVASLLPLLLRRLGIDPAVVSGPMITTVVDGTGLLIYFSIARAVISTIS